VPTTGGIQNARPMVRPVVAPFYQPVGVGSLANYRPYVPGSGAQVTVPTPPTPPNAGGRDMPEGFIPPSPGSINTQAFVRFVNPTTGEVFNAPNGGYTPPEGWVRG
jgi:hypothetical protein